MDKLIELIKNIKALKWWAFLFLLIGFIAYLFSEEIKAIIRDKTEDQVENGITKSSLVNDVLRQMMREFSAGRAYVWRFHNGVNYYDGSHKIKSSMDYEVVANGITPVGLFMQDLPTSLFADQINKIVKEEMLALPLDSIEDKGAKAIMEDFGISHTAVLPFYDSRGRLVMMIGVDWINREKVPFIEGRFRKYVDKIGRMLTNQTSGDVEDIFSLEYRLVRGQKQLAELNEYSYENEAQEMYRSKYVKMKKQYVLNLISNE